MERQHVGPGKQAVQIHKFHPQILSGLRLGAVVGDDVHPQSLGGLGGVDADTAGSDDAINDMSLCLRFEAGNFTFLDTGDAERNEEAALAEQYPFRLRSTVFKAGHHGSSTSNTQTLLWQVQPQLVVASCGLNNDYGHPHREVIQEMQDEGIDFYRTDLYGTVTVTAQADGSFTVQTAKQPDEELAPAA